MEIPRGKGVLKAKFLEAEYENKLEFPGGKGVGAAKPKTFHGGSMDINFLELHITVNNSNILLPFNFLKSLVTPFNLCNFVALVIT